MHEEICLLSPYPDPVQPGGVLTDSLVKNNPYKSPRLTNMMIEDEQMIQMDKVQLISKDQTTFPLSV